MKTNSIKQLCVVSSMSLAVALAAIGCSSSSDPDTTTPPTEDSSVEDSAAVVEARALMAGLASDGGTPYDVDNPINFPANYNVYYGC